MELESLDHWTKEEVEKKGGGQIQNSNFGAKDTTGEAWRCDMKSVKNKKPGLQVRIILQLLLSRTIFFIKPRLLTESVWCES